MIHKGIGIERLRFMNTHVAYDIGIHIGTQRHRYSYAGMTHKGIKFVGAETKQYQSRAEQNRAQLRQSNIGVARSRTKHNRAEQCQSKAEQNRAMSE